MRTATRTIAALSAVAAVGLSTLASPHGGHDAAPAPAPAPAPAAPAAPPAAHAAPAAATPTTAPAAHAAGVGADEALKKLADGNERFVAGAPARPNQSQARLCDTFANGQHPFAAVLSCADSRVPPELVFDTGIGDLFVVRVAGNVADVDEVGTLEYGVEHLGVNLVVVMGHGKCGAVTAVVEKAHVTPNIEKLVDNIVPAAEQARRQFPQLSGPRLVEKAIRANVRQSIADLSARSDLLRERIKSGKLKVVGAVYDLHTGTVDWLEPGDGSGHAAKPGGELLHGDATHGPTTPGNGQKADPHAAHGAAHGKGHGPTTGPATAGGHGGGAGEEPKKENYLALGGLVGGGAVASYGILHFLKSRRG